MCRACSDPGGGRRCQSSIPSPHTRGGSRGRYMVRNEVADIALEASLAGGGAPPDDIDDAPTVAESRAPKIIPGQRLETAYRNALRVESQMARAQRQYEAPRATWVKAEGAYLLARDSGNTSDAELARLKMKMDDADRAEQRARRALDTEAQELGFQTPESYRATIRHCRRLMDPRLRMQIEEAERATAPKPSRPRPATSSPSKRPLPPAPMNPSFRVRLIELLTGSINAHRQRKAAAREAGRGGKGTGSNERFIGQKGRKPLANGGQREPV